MKKCFSLDIFKLLNDIDNPKSGDLYTTMSDDERKGFAPLVVMRWMSGTSDERQIILLNEFVNPYVFSLGKHPHLLMQLLQTASSKTSKRYVWLGIKSKKKLVEAYRVIQEYFELSTREAKTYSLPPVEELIKMAEELGWQKDEIAKLQKELKENG
jgi:hypothetical protein